MTTQKLSFWPNSKTENMTKDKLKLRQNKNSDKKLSLWQNPKNPDSDKIQLKSWKLNFWKKTLKKSFGKNTLTPQQPMRFSRGSLLQSCDVFYCWCVHRICTFVFPDVLSDFRCPSLPYLYMPTCLGLFMDMFKKSLPLEFYLM